MQVNSVNMTSFRSNSINPDSNNETEKFSAKYIKGLLDDAQQLNGAVDNAHVLEKILLSNENKLPKKKNIVETAISFLGALVVSFLLVKKGYKAGAKALESAKNAIASNDKTKTLSENIIKTVQKNVNKILSSDKFQTLKGSELVANADKFVKKVGTENVVSGVGAVAGTAYIGTADSNNDGIADIAQKGVNAYKGILQKGGAIADAIQVLS